MKFLIIIQILCLFWIADSDSADYLDRNSVKDVTHEKRSPANKPRRPGHGAANTSPDHTLESDIDDPVGHTKKGLEEVSGYQHGPEGGAPRDRTNQAHGKASGHDGRKRRAAKLRKRAQYTSDDEDRSGSGSGAAPLDDQEGSGQGGEGTKRRPKKSEYVWDDDKKDWIHKSEAGFDYAEPDDYQEGNGS